MYNPRSRTNVEAFKRRGRLDIIYRILKSARNGQTKTRIMSDAGLNFKQLTRRYLPDLLNSNLLEVDNSTNKNSFRTTAQGLEFIKRYEDLIGFWNKSDEPIAGGSLGPYI